MVVAVAVHALPRRLGIMVIISGAGWPSVLPRCHAADVESLRGERWGSSPCSNILYRADPGSPVLRRLQYLHIPNHTTTASPPPLPPLTLPPPPPPPPPRPCSPHHPSLSPPPEAVVSTHKLSHVQQTLPCSQGQRRRQRPGQAESSPVVCRIRAKVGSLLYSLHVAQQQIGRAHV